MTGGARAKRALASYPPRCPILVIPGDPRLASVNYGEQDGDGRNNLVMTMWKLLFVKTAAVTLAALAGAASARAQALPGGFVFLRDIDPAILQDIRYAGPNNFVGRGLAGYDAAECVVKREVGMALKRIQQELAPQKLSLKMLDCYRPERAVHDMVAWARNGRETAGRAPLQSRLQQGRPVPAGLYRRAFRPFHRCRGRSHAGRS